MKVIVRIEIAAACGELVRDAGRRIHGVFSVPKMVVRLIINSSWSKFLFYAIQYI